MTIAIDVKKLNFSYKTMPVIDNISFCVKKGEFFVIIGPNGSGKTTLMKTISGIEKFKKGKMNILNKSVKKYSKRMLAKKIAFVPQTVPIDFPFTVTEMVLTGRAPYLGIFGFEGKKDIKIAKDAIAFTEIEHIADRKLNQLSGGERQRAFIARAICQKPQIILLDEPTASLDLAHQIKVMDLMEKLKIEKGITVVMVSHDLNLASMYGDTILLLKKGKIKSIGCPKEVITYDILKKTYNCELYLDTSPMGKFPRITLIPGKYSR